MKLDEPADPNNADQNAILPLLVQLNAAVANITTSLAEVKTDLAEVRTDVAEVRTDVAEVRTDLAEVRTDVAGIKTDVAEIKTELDKRVTHEDFQDAFLSLSHSLARTHARVIDNDIRAMALYREIRVELAEVRTEMRGVVREQALDDVLLEERDAHHKLERRVTRCEDELSDLRRRRN